jgi:hypothetical protein
MELSSESQSLLKISLDLCQDGLNPLLLEGTPSVINIAPQIWLLTSQAKYKLNLLLQMDLLK